VSGEPTTSSQLIIADSSPSLITVEGSDPFWDEVDAFLALDSSLPHEVDDNYLDPEGDILFLESLLNEDSSSPLPPKQLHNEEIKSVEKTDKIPEIKFKDLPPPLEYAILEEEVLILIAIQISLLPFTYPVISPIFHSFGSEDITFDPGIVHLTVV
jgi:hypothetical protein